MRSAEEWDVWASNTGILSESDGLTRLIIAIQADAIKAAASIASDLGDEEVADEILLKLLEPSP